MCRASDAGDLRQDLALALQGRSPVDSRASGLFLALCCPAGCAQQDAELCSRSIPALAAE